MRASIFRLSRAPIRIVIGLCLTGCLFTGCTFFKTVTIDGQGRKDTKYFQTEWDLFRASVDRDIELEQSEHRPPGQRQYWRDWWDSRILALRQNRENPERHIAYIHARRKEAGLSPLD
jgi:hypothetical protein